MSIDLESEELLTLRQAVTAFPGKKRLSIATMFRWINAPGVRGAVLETVCVGRTRYTSREAIERFIKAQNEPAETSATVSQSQRECQAKAAQKALRKVGV